MDHEGTHGGSGAQLDVRSGCKAMINGLQAWTSTHMANITHGSTWLRVAVRAHDLHRARSFGP